ncbi:tetraacyldisaccharide 4'-kinase [Massilia sp. PAMC28688]|uniref:tetraacyldisaccharide 4'-kinase n=1 Tax=Massilia sp. PAMC28688 TaxID=2861283 RepID=UPI001C634646|nr:tetraacyldisaccharide 4'-kinase [Massilia sp. PAMC28688]QYF94031.1 tetraacyldisaccharide 4'-kinase [Massilia sp. PAMC28688]
MSSSSLESTLTRAWQGRGLLACALWPLSLLFRLLAGVRAALFRRGLKASVRLPVPVVVVGNIYIGGTGKTPLTIWLAGVLRAAGYRPGIISRGFGSSGEAVREVTPDSPAQQAGDEPLLMALRTGCPVFVGRVRADAGRALLAAYPEVDIIISDDGLQHYALQRDVEIVLFDGRGTGNGWLLPAGPLREPVSRRRDFTVINAPTLTPDLCAQVGGAPVRMELVAAQAEPLLAPGQGVPLAALAGKRLFAAAGIGNPGRFFAMLRAAGLACAELPLPDHHDFLDQPFAQADAEIILITEKDAVKCRQIKQLRDDPRLWVVPVTAQLDGALAEHIVEKCRGSSIA